jgi:serine/threonine protein phosphatase 1
MSKTYVVGDLHGGLTALRQVLEKALLQAQDTLVFLGDYVDGWSDSTATIDFLIQLQEVQKCLFIRGNHDDLVLQYLQGKEMSEKWIKHGGQSSKDGYALLSTQEKEKHILFYKNLLDYHIDDANRMYCHAGFQNQNGPEAEWYSTAFYWDRTLWEMVCAMDKTLNPGDLHYPKRLALYSEIYIGHTPVTRLGETTPVQRANVWNIDTGAAFMGPVTLMDVETKEFWQSDPVWQLYPDETGRNPISYYDSLIPN